MDARKWHQAYDPQVSPELTFKRWTIPDIFERTVRNFPNNDAVIFMNCRLSYAQLKDCVDRLATALAKKGVGKDSKVAIHLPNLPQTVISTHAVLKLGAQCVMTNPLYVPREIEHQWNDSGAEVVITADFLYERHLRGMRGRLPSVREYIIASIPEYLRFPLNLLAPIKLKKMNPPSYAKVAHGEGISFFKKLVDGTPPDPPAVSIDFDDLALLQYTGGTTGVSKGAMMTHANISSNAQQMRAWFPTAVDGEEVVLAALPFFHIFGLTVDMMFATIAAGSLVLMPNPRDIPTMIKNINKHKVTLFPAVPAMFNAINQYPGIESVDISSIKSCFSGSAPLPLDVQQRFEELTKCRIVEGFGLTETSPLTHANPLSGIRKIGTIGVPVSSTDAKIVDPSDGMKEMPPGEEGELVVKGPQVMKGYWNRPEETAKTVIDGWLYTGDLAAMDEDGYFVIVGRKKDMILASGYNIYPDEIDNILMSFPGMLEACSIGIPDPKRGESVKSFVVLKPEATATEQDLIAHCRENLAPYKVPRMIEFREELPRSAMMKLLRRELRDEELKKLGAE